jgi:hypothetical protein
VRVPIILAAQAKGAKERIVCPSVLPVAQHGLLPSWKAASVFPAKMATLALEWYGTVVSQDSAFSSVK